MTPRRPFSILTLQDIERAEEEQGARRALDLHRVMRRVRRFTREIEDVVAEKPLTIFAVVASAGLVTGALLGSRLVRAVAALAVGYAVRELVLSRERAGASESKTPAP